MIDRRKFLSLLPAAPALAAIPNTTAPEKMVRADAQARVLDLKTLLLLAHGKDFGGGPFSHIAFVRGNCSRSERLAAFFRERGTASFIVWLDVDDATLLLRDFRGRVQRPLAFARGVGIARFPALVGFSYSDELAQRWGLWRLGWISRLGRAMQRKRIQEENPYLDSKFFISVPNVAEVSS